MSKKINIISPFGPKLAKLKLSKKVVNDIRKLTKNKHHELLEDLAEDMKKGDLNYDVIIATPSTMKVVSPLGQILGPKGLMPNPKSETVTKDVKTAVKNAKSGQIRYKSDKQCIIHTRIGQVGYSEEQVRDNLEAFLTDLKKAKPPSSKGVFISKVSISSTMGKGFDIDLTTLNF